MNLKKLGKALLFPHMAVLLVLLPAAAGFLVYSMVVLGTETPIAVASYVLAAYTFTSFAFAIVNAVRYRRYNSPIYSASKAISLAAASVSILTLESTMFTTFGGTMDAFSQKLMLGLSGGAVAAFIIVMAVYMIAQSTRKLKEIKEEDKNG